MAPAPPPAPDTSVDSSATSRWEERRTDGGRAVPRIVVIGAPLRIGRPAPVGTIRYVYSRIKKGGTGVYDGPDGRDHAFRQRIEAGVGGIPNRMVRHLQGDGRGPEWAGVRATNRSVFGSFLRRTPC
jgi:hypothetical protein